MSTFEEEGVLKGISLSQGRAGSNVMATVEMEGKGSVVIELPKNTPIYQNHEVKLKCVNYESGAISCKFIGYRTLQ